MKKLATLLTVTALVSTTSLRADVLGEGSVNSTAASNSIAWQNWTVAASALVAAGIGVAVVATNNGSASNSH